MDVSCLGFRTDLALLKLGGTVVDDRGDHLLVQTPDNPLFWWGNFLLLPKVPSDDQVDWWIRRHREEIPAARHVALGFAATRGAKADLSAFAARGMEVEVSTVMTAQRTRPPRSQHASAVNRALTSDEDWEQSLQLTLRCNEDQEAIAHERFARARNASYRRMVAAGHGSWFGAFLEDQLVAQMGLFTAGAGLARFQAVETDPGFRRRGLAGSLVHHVSQYGFDTLSATTLVMVADPEYVAIELYRAVGFSESETQLQAVLPPRQ